MSNKSTIRRSVFASATVCAMAMFLTTSEALAQRGGAGGGKGRGGGGNSDRGGSSASMAGVGDALAVTLSAPAAQVGGSLRAGSLATAAGVQLPRDVQLTLHSLLTSEGGNAAPTLLDALTSRGNAGAELQAVALNQSLQGMLTSPAARLRDATLAYNAFVDASSAEFLTSPPAEFLGIQAVLAPLVAKAGARK